MDTSSSPATTATPTILERIGGEDSVKAAVDLLYERLLADGEVAGFFTGVPLPRLKARQVQFFAAALGGPVPYRGRSMVRAHDGLGITQRHFDLVAGHLAAVLADLGVDQATVAEILSAVAPSPTRLSRRKSRKKEPAP